jgi:hypothetical protein
MAQSVFPEGVSTDIPPEKDPVAAAVEDVIDAILKPMNDFINGMEKVNDFAAAGRRVNLEH